MHDLTKTRRKELEGKGIDLVDGVFFYGGPFSNFYPSPIQIDGKQWATVEHYFQAMKTTDVILQEKMRLTKGPGMVKAMGQQVKLREDWEEAKDGVMLKALRAKYRQHPRLAKFLDETADDTIYEDSPTDYVWGIGIKGTGENRLGKLLMQVRTELREDEANRRRKVSKNHRYRQAGK